MGKNIVDGMKNEGKTVRTAMVVMYVASILYPIVIFFIYKGEADVKTCFKVGLLFFMLGCACLYEWIYSIKYKLTITEEKITVKTIFKKFEININDITKYTYKKYGKTVFYKFKLFTKGKGLMVSTRYKDELIEILEENQIKLIQK